MASCKINFTYLGKDGKTVHSSGTTTHLPDENQIEAAQKKVQEMYPGYTILSLNIDKK